MEEFLEQLDVAKALVIGLVIAGIYFFVAFDDGTTLEAKIAQNTQTIEKNKRDIVKYNQTIEKIYKFTEKMNQLGGEFDQIVRYLPEEFTTVDQMQIISNEAKAAGASIESVADGGMGKKMNYFQEMRVGVSLKGSYTQIVLFLSYLTKTNRVITMDNMKMVQSNALKSSSLGGEVASVLFTGNFIGYRYIGDKEKGKN